MNANTICVNCMKEKRHGNVCPVCGLRQDMTPEPSYALPLRSILHGKYLIGKSLGHGGFGITYIAWDLEKEKRVAVKEYLPDGLGSRIPGTTAVSVYSGDKAESFKYGMGKFLDEARTIYKFNSHPGIISVFELFEENGTAYYVMEFIDGMDLKHYTEKHGNKLTFSDAITILLPVFDALRAVHDAGFIHRDISPDNIYVASDGSIKLLDFGAARHAVGEKSQSLSVILKMGFAPEEQYRSKGRQGPWTDIYALAATVYKIITGQMPPESPERVVNDSIKWPSQLGTVLPAYAEAAIITAMAVRARDRFQNMLDFRNAITGKSLSIRPIINKLPVSMQGMPASRTTEPDDIQACMQYAGFWKRFAAYFIDSLLVSVLISFNVHMFGMGGAIIVGTIIAWIYFALLESSQNQATLGKMALGITVVGMKAERISFGAATGRFFGKMLSAVMLMGGFIMAGFTERKQALHDMMAGTVVLDKKAGDCMTPAKYDGMYHHSFPSHDSIPARNSGNMPMLLGIDGLFAGKEFLLDGGKTLIGRNSTGCQIVFPVDAPGISGLHCSVGYFDKEDLFVLEDMGSTYGTFLESGQRILQGQPVAIRSNQRFYLGNRSAMFEVRNIN